MLKQIKDYFSIILDLEEMHSCVSQRDVYSCPFFLTGTLKGSESSLKLINLNVLFLLSQIEMSIFDFKLLFFFEFSTSDQQVFCVL